MDQLSKLISDPRAQNFNASTLQRFNVDLAAEYTPSYFAMFPPWQHEYTRVADLLASELQFDSVLDLGCGAGFLLARLHELGKTVVGVDGSIHAIAAAPPEIKDKVFLHDLTRPWLIHRQFDLVICTEVAEHLDGQFADLLVDTICQRSRRFAYFSAAVPGQGGTHHVNEQPHEYWIQKFAHRGFSLLAVQTDSFRQKLAIPAPSITWFAQNSLIFQAVAKEDPRRQLN